MSLRRLSEFQTAEEFLEVVTRSSLFNTLDAVSLATIWATLSVLRASTSSQLGFLPVPLILTKSYLCSPENVPSSEAQKFLKDLTSAAHATSESLFCSSVLAGLSSESDEYGDVGLWLGDVSLGETREQEVVGLLGLEYWVQNGGRIVSTETSPQALPAGLIQFPKQQHDAVRDRLDGLISLISRLEQRFEFRLEGAGQGGRTIWFLVGRLAGEVEQAWVGLVGAGTWGEA